MKFSNYAIDWLFEEEGEGENDMINKIKTALEKIKHLKNTVKFVNANIENFAKKNADNAILQYHKSDSQTKSQLINALNADGAFVRFSEGVDFIIEVLPSSDAKSRIFGFRETGKAISQYWSSGVGAEKTNYQEIGVLIWVDILKNNPVNPDLKSFDIAKFKKKIKTDKDDDIKKTFEWLEASMHKKGGWCEQCKNSALGILSKIPQIKTTAYEYHQGGVLFNTLRTTGSKLSRIPGQPDKWNPSDIYFVKSNITVDKIKKFKDIHTLNTWLGEFDECIGVSLKGAESAHGGSAMRNIFEFIGVSTNFEKWNVAKDKKLTPQQKKKFKAMLKNLKSKADMLPFEKGCKLYITKGTKYDLDLKIDNMLDLYVVGNGRSSKNWFQSLPVILQMFEALDTKDKWQNFVTSAFCLATSQVSVSAKHYKADGQGHCVLINPGGIDASLIKPRLLRIPLSGEMDAIMEVVYAGTVYKLQIRSKGSLPICESYKRDEGYKDAALIKQFKF